MLIFLFVQGFVVFFFEIGKAVVLVSLFIKKVVFLFAASNSQLTVVTEIDSLFLWQNEKSKGRWLLALAEPLKTVMAEVFSLSPCFPVV